MTETKAFSGRVPTGRGEGSRCPKNVSCRVSLRARARVVQHNRGAWAARKLTRAVGAAGSHPIIAYRRGTGAEADRRSRGEVSIIEQIPAVRPMTDIVGRLNSIAMAEGTKL